MLKYFSVFSQSLVDDENGQGFYLELCTYSVLESLTWMHFELAFLLFCYSGGKLETNA